MYYLALTLAAIGGALVGIVAASLCFVCGSENAEFFEERREDDEY